MTMAHEVRNSKNRLPHARVLRSLGVPALFYEKFVPNSHLQRGDIHGQVHR